MKWAPFFQINLFEFKEKKEGAARNSAEDDIFSGIQRKVKKSCGFTENKTKNVNCQK